MIIEGCEDIGSMLQSRCKENIFSQIADLLVVDIMFNYSNMSAMFFSKRPPGKINPEKISILSVNSIKFSIGSSTNQKQMTGY